MSKSGNSYAPQALIDKLASAMCSYMDTDEHYDGTPCEACVAVAERFAPDVEAELMSPADDDLEGDTGEYTPVVTPASTIEVENLLNDRFGHFYTSESACVALDSISHQELNSRVNTHQLLCVETSDGKKVYPQFQFDGEGSIVRGLTEVLQVLLPTAEDEWVVLYWLTASLDHYNGQTAIDIIRAGNPSELEDILEMARIDVAAWQETRGYPVTSVPCGVVHEDSEDREPATCSFPKGHGPVTNENDDIYDMAHGNPQKGVYWNNESDVLSQLPKMCPSCFYAVSVDSYEAHKLSHSLDTPEKLIAYLIEQQRKEGS